MSGDAREPSPLHSYLLAALKGRCGPWPSDTVVNFDHSEHQPDINNGNEPGPSSSLPLRWLLEAIKAVNAPAFILPNTLGAARDLGNLADLVITPVLDANGLEGKGWHAYRRSLATNLKELAVDDGTIQYRMRHQDVSAALEHQDSIRNGLQSNTEAGSTDRSYSSCPPIGGQLIHKPLR
jgi:hypothetical protein